MCLLDKHLIPLTLSLDNVKMLVGETEVKDADKH